MQVTWDENVCIHSGKCVSGCPEVFKVENEKFVIHQDAATEEEIRATVAKCPSGALKIQEG